MAMQPDVLILDEPTAQLDPIAAADFLETVKRINREIGTTIIMIEHRLEDVFPMADRAVIMDKGKILIEDVPGRGGKVLAELNHPMLLAMPTPMQVYESLSKEKDIPLCGSPVTVREGRTWLTDMFSRRQLTNTKIDDPAEHMSSADPIIRLKDVWFRYSKDDVDVIKGLSMEASKGRLYCIVGGNGTGKTTALSVIGGINKPYRGKVLIKGESLEKQSKKHIADSLVILPQNPQTLFVEKTVSLDLMEILEQKGITPEEKQKRVEEIADLVEIRDLLESHPYDLSGGEQQRAALAKVLLAEPEILLLDEPTKGLDNYFKQRLARILKKLTENGVTIIMVSHDVEFCGKYGDVCAMFFDGNIVTTNTPKRFFSGNSFYTTAANRMSRHIFENAVTVEDVVNLCESNLNANDPGRESKRKAEQVKVQK